MKFRGDTEMTTMINTTSIEFQVNSTRNVLEACTIKELRETARDFYNIDLKGNNRSKATIIACILENVRKRLEAARAPLTPSQCW
jgi:hypothetical protein